MLCVFAHDSIVLMKNFDEWNTLKKRVDDRNRKVYVKEREIWWCTLGLNVGAEIDGKNQIFERPVLILKAMSVEAALILPLTTKCPSPKDHVKLIAPKMSSYVKLSQAKVVSVKRFSRKIDIVPKENFLVIKGTFIRYIS